MSREPVNVEAHGIRAVFEHAGDRWAHRIELTRSSRPPVVVMRSLEGAADEAWPPSPVLQELHFHVEPDGTPAAVGVGMSGPNHWSLSCRAVAPGGSKSWFRFLQFDVACRATEAFERVGACYRIVPEASARDYPQRISFRCREGQWSASSNADMIWNANQMLRVDVFGQQVLAFPQTVQWGYVINRLRTSNRPS